MKIGTVRSLCYIYLMDPLSGHHKNRYVTKRSYYNNLRRLIDAIGDADLATLTVRDIKEAHARWCEGGHIPMAYGLITMLRIVLAFGAGVLEDPDCQRICFGLAKVKFPNAKPREHWIRQEQVTAIIDQALIDGAYSIALAVALQWAGALRQKDVIGEWVPLWDPRPSQIVTAEWKWVGGICRDEIDSNLVLRHRTSKRGKVLTLPLGSIQIVMNEWNAAPASGPLIIDPDTDLPFRDWTYRRRWRDYATKAHVPENLWNMDTRAGRITTVLASGALPDDARKLATHSHLDTTMRYSRGDDEAVVRAIDAVETLERSAPIYIEHSPPLVPS